MYSAVNSQTMLYFILLYVIILLQLAIPVCDWIGTWLTITLTTIAYIVIFILLGHSLIVVTFLVLLFVITTPYPRKPLIDFLTNRLVEPSDEPNTFGRRIKQYFVPF